MAITMDGVELGVQITEKAAEKIKYFAEKEGIADNVGLRVAVKGGGCSGLTYDLKITDEELEMSGLPHDRYRIEFADIDRGKTAGDRRGFAEVTTRKGRDSILGATIVGEDAGEQITGLCLAMSNGLGLGALGKAMLPYPTRGEFLRRLSDQYNRTRLSPAVVSLMKAWFRYAAR